MKNYEFDWPLELSLEDKKQIVELYNSVIQEESILGFVEVLNENEGLEVANDLAESLSRGDKKVFLVRQGQKLIGLCLINPSTMPNCRHSAELSKGIIHPSNRGSGLLREAFLAIAVECRKLGYDQLVLDVRENSRSHQLWSYLGFKRFGRLVDYARVNGQVHSGVYMSQRTADLEARLKAMVTKTPLMEKEDFKRELREELESKITLEHPIFAEVLKGEPNWSLLRMMALQGYQLTKHFLEYIETLFYYCPEGTHKRRLLFNMFEEETGRMSKTKNHVTLMKDFIRAIGISDEERDAALPFPETKALIDYRMNLVKNPDTYHMGAAAVMIASEGQNLETKAGQARDEMLPRIYGLTEKDLLFFSVHQVEDVGHVKEGIALVADYCSTPEQQQEALEAVRVTCDLFIGMYDGISREYWKLKAA